MVTATRPVVLTGQDAARLSTKDLVATAIGVLDDLSPHVKDDELYSRLVLIVEEMLERWAPAEKLELDMGDPDFVDCLDGNLGLMLERALLRAKANLSREQLDA